MLRGMEDGKRNSNTCYRNNDNDANYCAVMRHGMVAYGRDTEIAGWAGGKDEVFCCIQWWYIR